MKSSYTDFCLQRGSAPLTFELFKGQLYIDILSKDWSLGHSDDEEEPANKTKK